MTGRPSIFTPDLAARICGRIAAGESVRTITRDDDMPDEWTVYRWVNEDREGFAADYRQARIAQAERLADELMDIADDGTNDYVERETESGKKVAFDGEHYMRSRLRVDTRKWYLSKVLPKIYGDKVQHTGDGGGPIKREERIELTPESIAMLDKIIFGRGG